ncbi:MAG: type II toxin-antitoxin system VapC family toxin [Ignavibacteria bacterium]|nr:type II toxin-antitoxin system VapC family toxin [Ignavibacteria bacterium]
MNKSLLVDTHTLLWYDDEPDKLSGAVRKVLRNPNATIFVSPISLYEIAQKVRRQSLPSATHLVNEIHVRLRLYGFTILPVNDHHALRAANLDSDHRDPFDRMIAAQALEEHCVLVTKDVAFAGVSGLKTLW